MPCQLRQAEGAVGRAEELGADAVLEDAEERHLGSVFVDGVVDVATEQHLAATPGRHTKA